ncbi:hypothetical protein J1605_008024 [Eschrichtius robustus]|uniref:Uncharacterized protein n=1 Tax=Eschrichtius robustus TaxID=9764 RepID=A0AB34GZ07_ESCRO|nr:hypothetical protein J1605_008024 [Eschrichtius robustus]
MLLIRGIQSSAPASPSPLHINLNYNPKVQTLCSSRREQSPVSPGTEHFLYPAEGERTSPLLQPWPRAHPSHEHKASALGALVPDAGAPLPSPQQLQPPLALSLLQEVGTSWEQRSCGALKMSVSVPSTLLLLLAFMASSPSAVSLSRKVRVWCPIHLDTQGTQNGDRPRTGPQGRVSMTPEIQMQRVPSPSQVFPAFGGMTNELQPTMSMRGGRGGVKEERIPSREMTTPEQDAGNQ